MAVAKREAQRHQSRLEKKQEKSLSEKVPVLAKSVSHYSSMAPVANRHEGHNCIADSCSVQGDSDGAYCLSNFLADCFDCKRTIRTVLGMEIHVTCD
ncbi:unnamed protein product [Strongylus vulgaris]|uniref:Uncharacterized protein n=1 Tax=Strongylus vulgaris TaxID=40348 RepID=A0A3P7I131_STRVU|nr:unnamed protein product [Strongylus vulgaris]